MRKSNPYYERIAEDRIYQKFLNPNWSQAHRNRCESVFQAYLQFFEETKELKLTPTELLDRAKEDRQRSHLERGELEREWLEFIHWLETSYTKRHKGPTKRLAPATIRDFGGIVKQFYKEFGYVLSSKARFPHNIRHDRYGRKENQKKNLRPKDVKALLNVMKSNRDKAMALVMFQSGMDLKTMFSLTYGDIKREFDAGKTPLVLHVKRGKSSVIFRTCIGRDAVEAIRNYLRERTARRWCCNVCDTSWMVKRNICPFCKKKGIANHRIIEQQEKITTDSFLFIPAHQNRQMAKSNFDQRFRRYGVLAGLVTDEELEKADMNPARPYALRGAFSSILGLNGMDRDLIEYMMGHTVPYRGAYLGMSDDELRELYQKYEEYLSVTEIRELEDVRKELTKKIERQEFEIAGMDKLLKETRKLLKETRNQLNNLSQSLVKKDDEEDQETAQKILEVMLGNPELLKRLEEELKKL